MLQELRDVSGMATEYFEDVIAPSFKQRMQDYTVINPLPLENRSDVIDKKSKKICQILSLRDIHMVLLIIFSTFSDAKPQSVPVLEMALLREACLKNNRNILKMEKKYTKLSRKVSFNIITQY